MPLYNIDFFDILGNEYCCLYTGPHKAIPYTRAAVNTQNLSLSEAVTAITTGRLILFPTETFFAIGGSALSDTAAQAVFLAKKRLNYAPLPVIIGDFGQLGMLTKNIKPELEKLAAHFWPGPLSIICPASGAVPRSLTSGGGTVAVRLTAHPAARALCLESGKPLIATSANLSGQAPVILAKDLAKELLPFVAGCFDPPLGAAQQPKGGKPSTIVEILDGNNQILRILREGAISAAMLAEAGFKAIHA